MKNALACVLALTASALSAAPIACTGVDAFVRNTDTNLTARICSVAANQAPVLAACHLSQKAPFHFTVVEGLSHNGVPCHGQYDCRTQEIQINRPGSSTNADRDSVFSRLDPMALFDSLIVHEMVHALIHQTRCKGAECIGNQEYIAYAMQLESLDAAQRNLLIDAVPARPTDEITHLNPVILQFAPDHFAVWAWQHFKAEGHGCAFVEKLLDGRVRLELPDL